MTPSSTPDRRYSVEPMESVLAAGRNIYVGESVTELFRIALDAYEESGMTFVNVVTVQGLESVVFRLHGES